jgi:hypothetical protein
VSKGEAMKVFVLARRCAVSTLVALAVACPPSVTEAARGVVVYKKSRCDYYIVNTTQGFALLEWYGGNDPDEGDVLGGDFESNGMKDIQNLTRGAETRVWVEDYWLSRTSVIQKYREQCRLE